MNSQFADAYIGRGTDYFNFLLGLALDNLGRTKKAIVDYRRAIDLNPHLPDAYYLRGIKFSIVRTGLI